MRCGYNDDNHGPGNDQRDSVRLVALINDLFDVFKLLHIDRRKTFYPRRDMA